MIVSTAGRRGQISTARVTVIGMKWVRRVIAKKVVAMHGRKVATTTAHVATAKTAAAVGAWMARREAMAPVAKPTKTILAVCGEMDHRAVTVRPATPTKAPAIVVQMAHHVVTVHLRKTALAVSMALGHTVITTRIPAEIKKKAAISPKLRFEVSLVSTRGARLFWSQPTRSPGCFISEPHSESGGAIVPNAPALRAESYLDGEILG